MHRPTLALLVVIMVVGAIALWIWPPGPELVGLEGLQGSFIKMSILLGTLWLAEPTLRPYPAWMVLAFLVGVVFMLAALRQPGLLRIAIPVLVILWLTRRGKRPGSPPRTRPSGGANRGTRGQSAA